MKINLSVSKWCRWTAVIHQIWHDHHRWGGMTIAWADEQSRYVLYEPELKIDLLASKDMNINFNLRWDSDMRVPRQVLRIQTNAGKLNMLYDLVFTPKASGAKG